MIEFTKTETEAITVKVGFRRILEYKWRAGTAYDVNDYVRPLRATGFEYQCTTAGQTSRREPKWPTTLSGTVTDGTVVWTAVAFGTGATDTIVSVNLETPTGITTTTPVIDGTDVVFTVSGGDQDGSYLVSIEVTTSAGEVFEEKLRVDVSAP